MSLPILDTAGRALRSLRISLTDRCNLRCSYCMPEENYVWLEKQHILRYEEISTLLDAFLVLGVDKVRLTGGEPLLRRDLCELVRRIAAKDGIRDLAMTTNAATLAPLAEPLRSAGLDRITVSLDTLDPERFRRLTRRDELASVLEGIDAAHAAGFRDTKLNTVVMRGVNDDELVPLLELGREKELEVRFIEYMDVGGATRWDPGEVVSRDEMLERLEAHYGPIESEPTAPSAPARRFRLPDGTRFGIIASTTRPFCSACDRARLTADGRFFLCLYATEGVDLARPLRAGATRTELAEHIAGAWSTRDDRGAEQRLEEAERRPLEVDALRVDPHLEMHTRGG